MRLMILGATGTTGQEVVRLALEAGHEVVVYARDPSKSGLKHPCLQYVKGALNDQIALTEAMQGVDVVVSALGPRKNRPDDALAVGMEQVLDVMKRLSVRRLIVATGAGVLAPEDRPRLLDRVIRSILRLVARHILENSQKMIDVVCQSELDWVILRGPRLLSHPGKQKVRMDFLGGDVGSSLTYTDFARALLMQLNEQTWLRKMPVVSN